MIVSFVKRGLSSRGAQALPLVHVSPPSGEHGETWCGIPERSETDKPTGTLLALFCGGRVSADTTAVARVRFLPHRKSSGRGATQDGGRVPAQCHQASPPD